MFMLWTKFNLVLRMNGQYLMVWYNFCSDNLAVLIYILIS